MLTCVSVIVYPDCANAALTTRVEVDDAEKFIGDIKTFIAGRGFESPQMKEFLKAPKQEWNNILDRFAARFGFSPRVLADLFKGRAFLGAGEKMVLLGVVQKDSTAIEAAVTEFRKFADAFPSVRVEIKEVTAAGNKITEIVIPGPEWTVLAEARGNRLFIAFARDREAAEELRREFFAGSLKAIAREENVCPEARGKGLVLVHSAPPLSEGQSADAAEAMKLLGVNDTSYTRFYFEDNNLWVVGYRPEGEGLLTSQYVEGPVSGASLAWLPAECESAGALHYNVAGLIPRFVEGEGPVQEQVRSVLETAKKTIDMDVQGDLLAHVGDEIVFGQLPMDRAGGFPLFSAMGLNNIYAAIKLKDAVIFEPSLDKLLNVAGGLAAMDTVGGGVRHTHAGGVHIRYLKVACGALSPCFAVKDGYLVATLNVPLMKYLLSNHGSWEPVTEDEDFKKQLDLLGGKLTGGFSYKRYHEAEVRGTDATSVLTSVAVVSILAGMLLPALSRARGEARKASCKSNLKQIGLCCKMYAQDHNDRWPEKLSELHPMYAGNVAIFSCPQTNVTIESPDEIDSKTSYVLVASGMDDAEASRGVAVYEKAGIHKGGSNVLFGDGHVEWVQAPRLAQLIGGQPKAFEGVQVGAPGQTPLRTKDMKDFVVAEARNLAATVDLALFPSVGDFRQEGNSNISIIEVRDRALFSKAKIGHVASGSGGGTLAAVAVAAIVAAIAIPSLLRSRIAANEACAIGMLKQLTSHEAAFRQVDADGNGVKDYWTADVAGFYAISDVAGNQLKFVDVVTAKADIAPAAGIYTWTPPAVPIPKAGYYYKAIALDESGRAYCQDPDGDGRKTTNVSKYAFCAYPAQYGKGGVRTFIINEEGVVYTKDTGGRPVETWPGPDPTAGKGWAVAG